MKNHIYLFTILLLVACTKNGEQTENTSAQTSTENGVVELTPEQFKIAGIVIGKFEKKNMSASLLVNGVLDVPPQKVVSVSAKLGGSVSKTDVLQGMKVKKGQLLAVIQNQEYFNLQQDYIDAKSKTEYLKIEDARQKQLAEENVSSTKVYQQAHSDFISLQGRMKSIEGKLKMLNINAEKLTPETMSEFVNIYSPINGYITVVNINIGSYVNPQDIMMKIVDTEHIHAELSVFEKDITLIQKGQKVRFTLVNAGDKERTAKIFLINRQIEEDRTVRVHAHLDQEEPSLIPGMFLKAMIEMGETLQNAVPEKAVINSGGKDYIFILKNEKKVSKDGKYVFKMLEVKKGLKEDGFVAISLIDSFRIDDLNIVTSGAYSLISKAMNSEE